MAKLYLQEKIAFFEQKKPLGFPKKSKNVKKVTHFQLLKLKNGLH